MWIIHPKSSHARKKPPLPAWNFSVTCASLRFRRQRLCTDSWYWGGGGSQFAAPWSRASVVPGRPDTHQVLATMAVFYNCLLLELHLLCIVCVFMEHHQDKFHRTFFLKHVFIQATLCYKSYFVIIALKHRKYTNVCVYIVASTMQASSHICTDKCH